MISHIDPLKKFVVPPGFAPTRIEVSDVTVYPPDPELLRVPFPYMEEDEVVNVYESIPITPAEGRGWSFINIVNAEYI